MLPTHGTQTDRSPPVRREALREGRSTQPGNRDRTTATHPEDPPFLFGERPVEATPEGIRAAAEFLRNLG